SSTDCFALLDDCDASTTDARSRLYTNYLGSLVCQDVDQWPALLQQMQQALQQGRFAVCLFSYELGAALHDIAPLGADQALAEVLLFEGCEQLSAEQVSAWL